MQVTCNAYTFERFSLDGMPVLFTYFANAVKVFIIWPAFNRSIETVEVDLLLAQYNLRHFVCVIVLIVYIFNMDVAGSVHFNVVADDLTMVTKIRI